MKKNKLKLIIALSVMLLGSVSYVSAAPVSKIDNIKNNTLLIGEHIFELDKTKENVYNTDSFVKAAKTLGNNDTIYYKISDHWIALNNINTTGDLINAIKEVGNNKDSIVKDMQVKKVNGMFVLETYDNYSIPETGTLKGSTKISNLNLYGIVGAEKWKVKVQDGTFDIPVLDSIVEGAEDYTVGSNIKISSNQHLLLLATDNSGKVKGYADLVVGKDFIADVNKAVIVDNSKESLSDNSKEPIFDNSQKTKIVNIKDAKLKETINIALGKDRDIAANITVGEMETLKELSSDKLNFLKDDGGEANRGITNISGLEYAINLEKLDLSENRISDLTPIKNLKKIKFLEVFRNNISDLRPLMNLKELEHLDIYNNARIVDTTPISSLTKLKWIDMHYCSRRTAPVNVKPLGKLINLEYLSIDDNYVEDISFAKNLTKLTTFSCNNNHVTDLSAIQNLAIAACNDWSGEHFFNMFAQFMKAPVKVKASSQGTVYKMKTPVKGIAGYVAKIESVIKEEDPESTAKAPGMDVLKSDNDYVSAVYNHDTDEIELTVAKNTKNEKRSCKYTIMLDYSMYSLKIEFDITQEALVPDKTSKPGKSKETKPTKEISKGKK